MSTLTPNHGLKVPESTDTIETVKEDYAYNLGKIDEDMGGGGGSGGHTIVNENGTDMPAESKLQFTGGVTVTDDSVNGKTVVDISGSSVVELTQAEYEALPDGKLSDDILYGLKDVKSFLDADILYLGTCYSLSERMVGCWTDGKPLYAKTLNPSVNVGSNTINHGIANLEKCIRIYGVCKYNNTNEQLPLPYVSTNSSYVIALGNVTATTYLVDVESGFSSIQECYITLFYTKTTDVAGSGTWTPSGVNAVHYDTNEQIIGTYLGKTLYEKTFNVGTASFDSNLQISITNGLSNIEYIVDYGGSAKEPRDNRNIPLPYFRKSWNESIVPQIMQLPDGTVSTAIVTNDSFYTSLQNIVLWVRYTKSSS